jgi:hypothetical protein
VGVAPRKSAAEPEAYGQHYKGEKHKAIVGQDDELVGEHAQSAAHQIADQKCQSNLASAARFDLAQQIERNDENDDVIDVPAQDECDENGHKDERIEECPMAGTRLWKVRRLGGQRSQPLIRSREPPPFQARQPNLGSVHERMWITLEGLWLSFSGP